MAPASSTAQDDNFWSGPIELDTSGRPASALVNSNAGNLDLTGGIDAETASYPLTFGGSGNVIVSSVGIGPNAGNVTKDGSGSLTLSTPDSYTGSTTVTGGWLVSACSGTIPTARLCRSRPAGTSLRPGSRPATTGAFVDLRRRRRHRPRGQRCDGPRLVDARQRQHCQRHNNRGRLPGAGRHDQRQPGGQHGLTMRGDGTVVLTGTNSYTAGTTIKTPAQPSNWATGPSTARLWAMFSTLAHWRSILRQPTFLPMTFTVPDRC